jgi:hypothetical protein
MALAFENVNLDNFFIWGDGNPLSRDNQSKAFVPSIRAEFGGPLALPLAKKSRPSWGG